MSNKKERIIMKSRRFLNFRTVVLLTGAFCVLSIFPALAADTTGQPSAPFIDDSNTLALFHFDEASPNLWKDTVEARAAITPEPSGVFDQNGRFGGALRIFPRKEKTEKQPVLVLSNTAGIKDVFSIEVWVKFQGAQGNSPMIGRDVYVIGGQNCFIRYSVDRNTIEFNVQSNKGWIGSVTSKDKFQPKAVWLQ